MNPTPITRIAVPVLLLCLALAACAGLSQKGYGRIDPCMETTATFESYRVNPQYRYYISGSEVHPNALMGLRRDYRLDPKALWKEVQMTPEKMKRTVEGMKTKAWEYRESPRGFDLFDDQGRPIGVWYSIFTARTFVRMGEDGTVRIDTPDLETYMKLEPKNEL